MIVLNEPDVFAYEYECQCGAMLQVEEEDLDCYRVTELNVDYLFVVECPVCGAASDVPASKVPINMRLDLKKIADSGKQERVLS